MNRILIIVLMLAVAASACSPAATPAAPVEAAGTAAGLKVSGGSIAKSYTPDDLKALGEARAVFKDVEYVGVPLTDLLKDAGFDPAQVKAVKAIASDGFAVNYDPALFNKADTLVAYARSDGALTPDDGVFRMVLPDQEGKLNPRNLVEIQVVQ